MEKEIVSAAYIAETNSTRVYYADGTFDAYPGNVVDDFSPTAELSTTESTDSQNYLATVITEPIIEANQVTTYEEGNQANGGGGIDGRAGTAVYAAGQPGDGASISEVGSVDAGGVIGNLPSQGGAAGDVPSGS